MADPNNGNGLGPAAVLAQIGQELNRDEDHARGQWSQITGVTGKCKI